LILTQQYWKFQYPSWKVKFHPNPSWKGAYYPRWKLTPYFYKCVCSKTSIWLMKLDIDRVYLHICSKCYIYIHIYKSVSLWSTYLHTVFSYLPVYCLHTLHIRTIYFTCQIIVKRNDIIKTLLRLTSSTKEEVLLL
jgi:hypothetical protein